jgi:hypothetical protein
MQKHILTPIGPNYIYHKNQKDKPLKKDLPFLKKTISQNSKCLDILAFIAEHATVTFCVDGMV